MAAARLALAVALREQPEFLRHVEQVAADPDAAEALARRYFGRDDHGRKGALIAALLRRAGAAYACGGQPEAEYAMWCAVAYFPGGEVSEGQPRRALRADQAETLLTGARRVARRGAGVCVGCGAVLGAPHNRDDCPESCPWPQPRPREGVEAEKALWRALAVGAARSRRARRSPIAQRAG